MLSTILGAGAIATLATTAIANPVAPGVVGFNFEKQRVAARDYPHLSRRQSKTVQADLTNELLLYFINVTVGTPPQPFSLQLDTGSSDIWFPDNQARLCQSREQPCQYGEYDASASSTFTDLNQVFQISYVDGTNVEGEYLTDVLNIGSTKITNMTMAAATQLQTPAVGIMGIGYQAGESISEQIAEGQGGALYPNVINQLKNEGFTNTLAYSLWLNDIDSSTGSILFGGVDTDKYHGDLIALPVQVDSQSGGLTSFTVAWTGLSFVSGGKTSDLSPSAATAAILDSGTTDLLLPDDLANQVYQGLGVITDDQVGNVLNCDVGNDAGYFSFSFGGSGGPVVNVTINEFLSPLYNEDGSQATFTDGGLVCQVGIDAAGQDPILFGDAFLRSAYVVYDLSDNLIGLAQTNFNATGSNIQAISGSSIPGVSSTASAVSVTQTASGQVGEPTASQGLGGFASGTVGAAGGTSRSATFVLTTATGSSGSSGGSSGSSGSSSAASAMRVPAIEQSTIIAGAVFMASFVFGGSLMIVL